MKLDMKKKKILIVSFFVVMLMLVSFNAVAYNPSISVVKSEFEDDLKLEKESIQEDLTGPFIICSVLMFFYKFFDGLETILANICENTDNIVICELLDVAEAIASALYDFAELAGCY